MSWGWIEQRRNKSSWEGRQTIYSSRWHELTRTELQWDVEAWNSERKRRWWQMTYTPNLLGIQAHLSPQNSLGVLSELKFVWRCFIVGGLCSQPGNYALFYIGLFSPFSLVIYGLVLYGILSFSIILCFSFLLTNNSAVIIICLWVLDSAHL